MSEKESDEEDILVEECPVCGGDIIIDSFCEEDDIVYCNDCEAEYLIRSLDPVKLLPLSDETNEEDDFDGEYEE